MAREGNSSCVRVPRNRATRALPTTAANTAGSDCFDSWYMETTYSVAISNCPYRFVSPGQYPRYTTSGTGTGPWQETRDATHGMTIVDKWRLKQVCDIGV